ncbi:MAG: OmpA family protein [Alphaproteobacteria bacterium]|nr:OmpA family protein [Alphaproteobacteria bacterium]
MRSFLWIFIVAVLAGCSLMRTPPATNTFVMFFDPGSAALSSAAKVEIDLAADKIKSTKPAHVAIAVYPKTITGDGSNPKLADSRFNAVEAALVADGVDARIVARAMLTDLEVKAGPDGNRRAEIRLFKN